MDNKEILKQINKNDLHCVLNKYCSEKLNVKIKTICYKQSNNTAKNSSEWTYPDVAGMNLLSYNWDSSFKEICNDFYVPKTILYSFKIEKILKLDNLKELYFKTVSNSTWANIGYLVVASLDESDMELMDEIERLNTMHGIGIIKLDILNPSNSSILFPAQKRDPIDAYVVEKLMSSNSNYKEYLSAVHRSLQINRIYDEDWDSLKDYDKLIKDKFIKKNKNINKEVDTDKLSDAQEVEALNNSSGLKIAEDINNIEKFHPEFYKINLSEEASDLSYCKPVKLYAGYKSYESTSWEKMFEKVATSLSILDKETFRKYVKDAKWMSRYEQKGDEYFYMDIDESGVYAKRLSAMDMYKEFQKIFTMFDIDLKTCILYVELNEE